MRRFDNSIKKHQKFETWSPIGSKIILNGNLETEKKSFSNGEIHKNQTH